MKRVLSFVIISLLGIASALAQGFVLNTRVADTKGQMLSGVMIESTGAETSAFSDIEGRVELKMTVPQAVIRVSLSGYYSVELPVSEQNQPGLITLIPEDWRNYTENASLNKKDMQQAMNIDLGIQGKIPGLQTVQKSGMPAEGAYMNIGGLHSLYAENTPLIVVNGVPYLNDTEVSTAINAYSRSLFAALNIYDIRNITLLTGAQAAQYGSLGSNGVLLIETERATSDNLDTRISFSGQYGMHFKGRTMEVLDDRDYNNYLREVGLGRYGSMNALTADYPFLQSSADYPTAYIFNNRTDWQKEIYQSAFLTNNVFRVEGGDEVAKYNMSVGYSSDGGIISGTSTNRYHTLLNSDIMVSRKVDIFTSVGLSYMNSRLQEQGMSHETNPMLAAWYKMPVLSPYFAGNDGKLTNTYATYDFSNINDYPLYPYENVSNPTAIVNTLEAGDKIYDVNINLGLNYQVLDRLKLTGIFNRQYRYVEENLFIPGVSNQAIYPQYYGIGRNTVRKAISERSNTYYGLNAAYRRIFRHIHELRADLGGRIMTSSSEYDMSSGYNTANDYYKTLDKTTDEENSDGYINLWTWANYYLRAGYTWNRLIDASLSLSLDGSSVSGIDAPLYYVYPAAAVKLMAAHLGMIPDWINTLDFQLSASLSGNSRFSSNYAKNYYTSSNFFTMGSIIRGDIPNTLLEPEKQRQLTAGLNTSLWGHRLQFGADFHSTYAYDLIIPQSISSVYASDNYYENAAAVSTNGMTLSLRLTPVETRQLSWTLGGHITGNRSIVKDLGGRDFLDIRYEGLSQGEDMIVRLKVGEEPYQFYGYETDGIYTTTAQARTEDLTSAKGSKFQAGDVRYIDHHADGVINEQDKVLLGSTRPDCFGSLFTHLRYGQFGLNVQFNYSIGGKVYNAVRRQLESMDRFYNQALSVRNRWQMEGQQTNMPRAAYGDPSGNNQFSDRWTEDASYLKLGALTLSYSIEHPIANFFRSGELWISAENLMTWTRYLGNDPETAYSYDDALLGIDYAKVPRPKTVKIGFNLNF
ncbi:MAG: SusC/RagA family TonB-linked outer membrane protein [Bacteroidales bacterium]|nr:SusC/RagA family TonB-linked outer membrane protein [Bacteroidales bacterium]